MTTTETETEVEIAKETKKSQQKAKQVDIEAINEVALAQSKQSKAYNTTKFEELKSEYAEIQQNNTPFSSIKEINEIQTDKQCEYIEQRESKNNSKTKNARIKNFIVCASIVFALSVGLIIYNAVEITLTNMQIANIETQISTGSANYENALKQLKKLTSAEEMQEQALDLNMSESNQVISADLIETRTEIGSESNSNWFNQLCNFLSNMFK